VCAFSLTSRITQRDGTTGRDAPGSPPSWTPAIRDRTGRLHRDVHGVPAACQNLGLLDIPGWRPPPDPGSSGSAGTRPAARLSRSPILKPGGIRRPGRAPVQPPRRCPRSAPPPPGGRYDGRDASAQRQSRKTLSAAEPVDAGRRRDDPAAASAFAAVPQLPRRPPARALAIPAESDLPRLGRFPRNRSPQPLDILKVSTHSWSYGRADQGTRSAPGCAGAIPARPPR
jgi:hypothetical protein